MAARKLYATITNCSGIKSVSVNSSHDNSSTVANFEVVSTSLTLGDAVTVDMGYTDDHQVIFTGYVKQIEHQVPENTYTILCNDVMVRAMEYFIASDSPASPLKYQNKTAESLVGDLMAKAGLTNYTYDVTLFTFGVTKEFEVNLVMVFDYCNAIADLLTWSLWADSVGTVHFENRKPYPMVNEYPENVQPGWQVDTVEALTIIDTMCLEISDTTSEKNLRNKVVVYGTGEIAANASRVVSLLPAGFYKTAVLGATEIVDDQATAQNIADYNLDMFCRYTQQVRATLVGNPSLRARKVHHVASTKLGVDANFYVSQCEHSLSSSGYTTSLGLRRMIKA